MAKESRKIKWLERKIQVVHVHDDFGHITKDCITLRKEISYLLSKEYLKEILGRRKERSKDPEKPGSSPLDVKVINIFSGILIFVELLTLQRKDALRYARRRKKKDHEEHINNKRERNYL